MARQSAGILLYRRAPAGLECLLAHPGGPFWARKDLAAWTIPKGQYADDEAAEDAARREFQEETGLLVSAPLRPLGTAVQPGGKRIVAFAAEGDFTCANLVSNHFNVEWPPRSGAVRSFPEIDRAAWFPPDLARDKILRGQRVFLDRLLDLLAADALAP